MDDKLSEIRKLNEESAKHLKYLGIDVNNLSNELHSTLDEYCDIKLNTNLLNINVNFLQDWYINKKVNIIKNKRIINNLESELNTLNNDIVAEEKEIMDLKEFYNESSRDVQSKESYERIKDTIKNKIAKTVAKEKGMVTQDFDLDDIINRISLLEKK